MRLYYRLSLFLLGLSFILPCPLIAMEPNPTQHLHLQEEDDWPFSDWELYKYLKDKLEEEQLERFDPPLYEMVTREGRKIYILGSLHNRHPALMLPPEASRFIKNLSGNAILFTEHVSPYEYFLPQLEHLEDSSQEIWDPARDFHLEPPDAEKWEKIKNISFYEGGPKIEDVKKMDRLTGAMLLYGLAGKKSKEKGLERGFENTLKELPWIGEIGHLESLEGALNIIEQTEEDLRGYFVLGLEKVAHTLRSHVNKPHILNLYINSIMWYSHNLLFDTQHIKISTIERNVPWSERLLRYLDENGRNEGLTPLLIVCGMDHLRGVIAEGSKSFLAYLFKSGKFRSLKRMRKDGSWELLGVNED